MPEPGDFSLPESFGLDREDDRWLEVLRDARIGHELGAAGGYELLAEIGRGGQGVVYRARAPGGEDVALKRLIRGAAAESSARRRLERELATAGSLDHPGIVRMLGLEQLGGQPVLVMEWIDGIPVTRWARRPGRAQHELLSVFEAMVEAVVHAHERHVLHRDLKPSNVLVDREGRPRILDFGLAKFLHGEERDGTRLTRSAAFLGTPAYAAPEQIEGRAEGVDARADVWALGVLLYEMLTGEMPYPRAETLAQALAIFERHEPKRPSTLEPRLDPELDALVLQAVRAARERRYPSAAALLADLRRYRAGKRVRARAPGPWYELRRFARRHKVAAAAALALALSASAWGVYAGVQSRRMAAQRDEARAARRAAETTAATRDEVLAFFLDDLLRGVATRAGGSEVTVLEFLDEAGALVGARFRDRPLVEAAVREALGGAYVSAGDPLTAHAHLALALERACVDPACDPLLLARYRRELGFVLLELQRPGEAREVALPALEAFRAAATPLELAASLLLVARVETWFGRFAETLRACGEGLALAGDPARDEARTLVVGLLCARTDAHIGLGELDAAERDIERATQLALYDHPEDHVALAEHALQMGEIRLLQGRFAEAAAAFDHVDHVRTRAWGEGDPRRAQALEGLARAKLGAGEAELALALGAAALELLEVRGLWSHQVHLAAERTRARALAALGRRAEARAGMGDVVRGTRSLFGEEHPQVGLDLAFHDSLAGAPGPEPEPLPAVRPGVDGAERASR